MGKNQDNNDGDVMLGMMVVTVLGTIIGGASGLLMYVSGSVFPLWFAGSPWWLWVVVYGGIGGVVCALLYVVISLLL